jgi:hypothetical protein
VVKEPKLGAEHSVPASADVKKTWICASTPHTPSWCHFTFLHFICFGHLEIYTVTVGCTDYPWYMIANGNADDAMVEQVLWD